MTRTKQFVGLAVLATLSWWAVAGTAQAQVTTADVVGRVTDASGGALPGATVTLTNPATGETRTQVTSDTGDYTFGLVPIGELHDQVELAGFTPVHRLDAALRRRPPARRTRNWRSARSPRPSR